MKTDASCGSLKVFVIMKNAMTKIKKPNGPSTALRIKAMVSSVITGVKGQELVVECFQNLDNTANSLITDIGKNTLSIIQIK